MNLMMILLFYLPYCTVILFYFLFITSMISLQFISFIGRNKNLLNLPEATNGEFSLILSLSLSYNERGDEVNVPASRELFCVRRGTWFLLHPIQSINICWESSILTKERMGYIHSHTHTHQTIEKLIVTSPLFSLSFFFLFSIIFIHH